MLFSSGYHGLLYIGTFSVTNITFVVSIQNTNVANTLVMIAIRTLIGNKNERRSYKRTKLDPSRRLERR